MKRQGIKPSTHQWKMFRFAWQHLCIIPKNFSSMSSQTLIFWQKINLFFKNPIQNWLIMSINALLFTSQLIILFQFSVFISFINFWATIIQSIEKKEFKQSWLNCSLSKTILNDFHSYCFPLLKSFINWWQVEASTT